MTFRTFVLILLVVLGAAVYVLGIRPRLQVSADLAANSVKRASVSISLARRARGRDQLLLPATLRAYTEASIQARTSGYVAKWLVDIGDLVESGQILAIIDAPEVDQQLNQARAKLTQAKANAELARVTADRWHALGLQHAVPQQEVDQKVAGLEAGRADVGAAQAEVDRLEQMKAFETVVAPFAGTISARNIDIGTLVAAGAGSELFHLAQSDILRAYVNVPQRFVRDIQVGLPVDIEVAEFPRTHFPGKVARVAGAMDATSNALQVEAQVPNADRRLLAGMFCEVRLRPAPANPPILIPSGAAIIRAEGTLVAVVTDRNTIELRPVKLGRDFGMEIEVLDGLQEDARVVDNPSDTLTEGQVVDPVPATGKTAHPPE